VKWVRKEQKRGKREEEREDLGVGVILIAGLVSWARTEQEREREREREERE
jgi:hypothetical protein